MSVRFTVNGAPVEVDAPGIRRLLDVLREDLGLTGTKEGCGEGECGACTVLLDGAVVDSCLVPLSQVDGHAVRTVEGLVPPRSDPGRPASPDELNVLQRAFLASGVAASDAAIREAIAGNLCRCTGYTKIIEAIALAADRRDGGAQA